MLAARQPFIGPARTILHASLYKIRPTPSLKDGALLRSIKEREKNGLDSSHWAESNYPRKSTTDTEVQHLNYPSTKKNRPIHLCGVSEFRRPRQKINHSEQKKARSVLLTPHQVPTSPSRPRHQPAHAETINPTISSENKINPGRARQEAKGQKTR